MCVAFCIILSSGSYLASRHFQASWQPANCAPQHMLPPPGGAFLLCTTEEARCPACWQACTAETHSQACTAQDTQPACTLHMAAP